MHFTTDKKDFVISGFENDNYFWNVTLSFSHGIKYIIVSLYYNTWTDPYNRLQLNEGTRKQYISNKPSFLPSNCYLQYTVQKYNITILIFW